MCPVSDLIPPRHSSRSALLLGLMAVLAMSCDKDKDTDASNGNGGSTPVVYELHLELDGAPVDHVEGSTTHNFVQGYLSICNTGITSCTCYQESIVSQPLDMNDRWSFGLIKTFDGLSGSGPGVDSVNTLCAVGPRAFGKFLWNNSSSNYDVIDGVRIEYTDAGGVKWSTDRGAADQGASGFEITEIISTGEGFGPRFKMRCAFHGVLYNDAGGSKVVSNGALFGPVIAG